MEKDDIVYLCLLIFTIAFGYFFRKLNDVFARQWISTIIGFLIVLLVSGKHIAHPVICVLFNSFIITWNKKICHIVSFCFTFGYLIFLRTSTYFGIPYAPSHTNLIQMILTLKITGLAFEIHDSYRSEKKDNRNETEELNPKFTDIVHFCFCYIGVLTGPYYSFKTFSDYNKNNYGKNALCESTTLKKLKYVPLFAVVFLLSTYYYPISYVDSLEFYKERSFWYRLFYIIPVFITFRMRIYIGLILSECACVMAGLGAYPSFTEPRPGSGPTKNLDKLKQLDNESLKKIDFNFDTVKNLDVWHTEFDPSVRSSIRYWNMCVQYWMAFVVYKRFPYKSFRTAAVFAVSTVWHGIYAGYFLCLGVVPFYLAIEDIWDNLLRKNATGNARKVLDALFWFIRTQAFSYMGMAFSLLTMERGLKYYGSVYFVYHITSIIALVSGLFLQKVILRQSSDQKLKAVKA